jgi:hypothetical protein
MHGAVAPISGVAVFSAPLCPGLYMVGKSLAIQQGQPKSSEVILHNMINQLPDHFFYGGFFLPIRGG